MNLGGNSQETNSLFKARLPGYLQAMVFFVEWEKLTIKLQYAKQIENERTNRKSKDSITKWFQDIG